MIAVSRALKENLIFRGVEEDKIVVIGNGLDFKHFSKETRFFNTENS